MANMNQSTCSFHSCSVKINYYKYKKWDAGFLNISFSRCVRFFLLFWSKYYSNRDLNVFVGLLKRFSVVMKVQIGKQYPIFVEEEKGTSEAEPREGDLALLHFPFLPDSVRDHASAELYLDASSSSGEAILHLRKRRREPGVELETEGPVIVQESDEEKEDVGEATFVGSAHGPVAVNNKTTRSAATKAAVSSEGDHVLQLQRQGADDVFVVRRVGLVVSNLRLERSTDFRVPLGMRNDARSIKRRLDQAHKNKSKQSGKKKN